MLISKVGKQNTKLTEEFDNKYFIFKLIVLVMVCIFCCGCNARSSEIITPELDEEAIVNMSEESLQYYGILVRDHCLQDMTTSFEENELVEFNENDEKSIRQFCASRIPNDVVGGTNCCIGEFVSRTEQDIFLRRYYILIVFGDYGVSDKAILIQYDWKVSNGNMAKTFIKKELMGKYLPND